MKGKQKHHQAKLHRAAGGSAGRAHEKVSGNPDVFKEAEDKKNGGKVVRAAGGKVAGVGKVIGLMTGGGVKARLDRPGRKRGGRVGADKSPLSSAHHGGHGHGETPRSGDTYGGTKPD